MKKKNNITRGRIPNAIFISIRYGRTKYFTFDAALSLYYLLALDTTDATYWRYFIRVFEIRKLWKDAFDFNSPFICRYAPARAIHTHTRTHTFRHRIADRFSPTHLLVTTRCRRFQQSFFVVAIYIFINVRRVSSSRTYGRIRKTLPNSQQFSFADCANTNCVKVRVSCCARSVYAVRVRLLLLLRCPVYCVSFRPHRRYYLYEIRRDNRAMYKYISLCRLFLLFHNGRMSSLVVNHFYLMFIHIRWPNRSIGTNIEYRDV